MGSQSQRQLSDGKTTTTTSSGARGSGQWTTREAPNIHIFKLSCILVQEHGSSVHGVSAVLTAVGQGKRLAPPSPCLGELTEAGLWERIAHLPRLLMTDAHP